MLLSQYLRPAIVVHLTILYLFKKLTFSFKSILAFLMIILLLSKFGLILSLHVLRTQFTFHQSGKLR
jgi:hypothetical protein